MAPGRVIAHKSSPRLRILEVGKGGVTSSKFLSAWGLMSASAITVWLSKYAANDGREKLETANHFLGRSDKRTLVPVEEHFQYVSFLLLCPFLFTLNRS